MASKPKLLPALGVELSFSVTMATFGFEVTTAVQNKRDKSKLVKNIGLLGNGGVNDVKIIALRSLKTSQTQK